MVVISPDLPRIVLMSSKYYAIERNSSERPLISCAAGGRGPSGA